MQGHSGRRLIAGWVNVSARPRDARTPREVQKVSHEFDRADELTLVHRARGGPGVAVVLKSLLESEGIHCVIKSESGTVAFALMPPFGLPLVADGPLGLFDVFVLNRHAERAREILSLAAAEDDLEG